MKEAYNAQFHVKDSQVKKGDRIFIKQKKKNKLSTKYGPTEFVVQEKRGATVIAQGSNGEKVMRNSS